MKKIVCLVLVLILCLCLCACGENKDDSSTYESGNTLPAYSVSTKATTVPTTTTVTKSAVVYALPTADELVDNYKVLFTLSDVKQENGKVSFKTSTGELVIGYTDGSGKVNKIWVHSSGKDTTALLQAVYHYYPVCQYVSDITGKDVTVDDLLTITNAVDPTRATTDLSASTVWNNRKDGIRYELAVCQYSSMSYCTMDFTVEVQG